MPVLEEFRDPEPRPIDEYREPNPREAEENLRVIREVMERSTKYSTFSGLSGILAGSASILGCILTQNLPHNVMNSSQYQILFLTLWASVMLFALMVDYLLMKRRAVRVGKRIVSRLGKQMLYAAGPGLGTGALLTLFFLMHNMLDSLFAIWMLSYGIAVCAVGQFSQREVKLLGTAFLVAGAIVLLYPTIGLLMMALSFGGCHIVYALVMSLREDR